MLITDMLLTVAITLVFVAVLWPLAHFFGWVDRPDHRKQHSGEVPLLGGPAIVLAVGAVLWWRNGWSPETAVLAWTSLLVFLTGFVDDRRHIPVPVRFALQIAALLCMVWAGGVELNNFGKLFWDKPLVLGLLSVPITVFSALGVINAFNMIDGMDGLSGSISLVALGGLAFLAGRAELVEAHYVLLVVLSAVFGFLLVNYRFPWRQRALVFLGDSGSSWLGFVLAWFFIALSQDDPNRGIERAYAPITAIWLFGVPLMDTTYVMIRRARVGEPIFGADRRHLHHLFLRSGFSVRQTWFIITVGAVAMALAGIVAELCRWPEYFRFYSFIALSFSYLVWMNHAWKNRRFLGRQVA